MEVRFALTQRAGKPLARGLSRRLRRLPGGSLRVRWAACRNPEKCSMTMRAKTRPSLDGGFAVKGKLGLWQVPDELVIYAD